MASIHDVVAYILKQQSPLTTMKVQKLCYYCQGWNLAWDGKPLFAEPIQAWANGPVIYELFDKHRGRFTVSEWPDGNIQNLSQDERDTIEAVVKEYGQLTGQQLSDLSHAERPWQDAWGDLAFGSRSDVPIDLDVMQDYFGSLAATQ